ncbi:MAG: site-specific DNA-methyltransferase [Spirochaetaceae bacterium]|jgi:adenine-specific DNA-methyltransferase|nr:site-specific DNA-methyltransferase [Spirochaetaceae bacterium]
MPKKSHAGKTVAAISHSEVKRKNIPTAEFQSVVDDDTKTPKPYKYRRNTDMDPQLVWRGKDEQDWSDLVVYAPPLYIQEKVHPKALIDDLLRRSDADRKANEKQCDLFADFNGIPEGVDKTEFYHHDQNWSNRMILGDSLQVMASLAERENVKGKVQCVYLDPPYGIKFNSNFQWSTTSREVKDGNAAHITREPEQVKAFRDTWRDGIHSYLTYLRDRLTVAKELLADSGSIFVQIGDENVHRVRALMDEVFGEENFVNQIFVQKSGGASADYLDSIGDYLLWYAKSIDKLKYRQLYDDKIDSKSGISNYQNVLFSDRIERLLTPDEKKDLSLLPKDARLFGVHSLTSARPWGEGDVSSFKFEGKIYTPGKGTFKTDEKGLNKLVKVHRIKASANRIGYVRYFDDFPLITINNNWNDTRGDMNIIYVVQTTTKIIQRCLLMTTDPGDLVLDPTCGSGTTAYVAEQWGRRWITIDTSRVALALARARIMGARYPYYLLADSAEGQMKEAELTQILPSGKPTHSRIRHGFVYERVPHITLKSIANNAEIDIIWEKHRPELEAARKNLNAALRGHKTPFKVETGGRQGKALDFTASAKATVTLPSGEEVPESELLEWEIPREAPSDWPPTAAKPLAAFWKARMKRQKEIDASIAAKAEFEYLYDRPYEDRRKVRVAGPFTVDSISPHRVLGVDENGDIIDGQKKTFMEVEVHENEPTYGFTEIILENLKTAGVQQAHKDDKINFTSLAPWPGSFVCAEGFYREGDEETGTDRRAAIFIGPEFGTVTRPDLIEAAREAADSGFDLLIACAFNYEAHTTEFEKLGKIKILKARMNADLHMAGDLRNNGKGNLFVIFGEPDVDVEPAPDGQIRVRIKGVDVFHPNTGEIRSDGPEGIACWFIDTDYNEESFFVRHAYFLGANDPYGSLKTSLKAEINADAWESLHSDISRPFDSPASGRIAVKVINHLGDEVMKVINVHKS